METVAIDSKLATFLEHPEDATDDEMRAAVAAMTLHAHPLVQAADRLVVAVAELKDDVGRLVDRVHRRKSGAR